MPNIPKKNKPDDSLLSLNNGKAVRFRKRKQQELEAEQELKDYEHNSEDSIPDRFHKPLYP